MGYALIACFLGLLGAVAAGFAGIGLLGCIAINLAVGAVTMVVLLLYWLLREALIHRFAGPGIAPRPGMGAPRGS